MKKIFEFHIISMSTYGVGLSGGDRIWIELSKRLGKKYAVFIYLWEEGYQIAKREGLKNVSFILWPCQFFARFGFFINYFARILKSVFKSLNLKLENSPNTMVYSASEFWQDSLAAFVLKLKFPKINWVAAWYQSAPSPIKGFSEGERDSKYRLRAFLYWFVQLPVKPIIKRYADLVVVNNEIEVRQFKSLNQKGKVLVMLGAVNLDKITNYKLHNPNPKKIYDGIFQGRLHPQKGVLELIDIWKLVVNKKPDAKLAIIGDGPLMERVKSKVEREKLKENIKLFGYVFDGPKKYKIFSQSRIVLHPSFFDSGGMASAEAMAFGLPAVGFDLVAYKSYYPMGMIKVRRGDLGDFAKKVLLLLNNRKLYSKYAKEGGKMLEENWSWDVKVESLLKSLS